MPSAKHPLGGNANSPPFFFAMPGSFNLISENYQNISDSELAGLDDQSTPHASVKGISSDDCHNNDHNSDHNDADQAEYDALCRYPKKHHARVQRAHLGQHCTLSDFEREHFHPLSVTPDRPCTAFINPSKEHSAKQIFDSFLCTGLAVSAVRCLHKPPAAKWL